MKKLSMIVLLTLLLTLSMPIQVWAEPTEQKMEPIITKEEAQMNMPPDDPIKYDKQKIEEILSLPPTNLDDMGITVRYLMGIGISKSMAESLIKSKFQSNVVNKYLGSIGSSKRAKSFAATRATGTCPCNYTLTTGVTVAGEANQMFNTGVSTTSSSISNYVTKARGIGRYVFGYDNSSVNVGNVSTSYFLYGEHSCDRTHEGLDVQYTANYHESFRLICDGMVDIANENGSGYGKLVLDHPNGTKHIIFLHANDYSCEEGNIISGSSFVGEQGGAGPYGPDDFPHHVHIEVRGTDKDGPADDQNNTLASYMPYDYLYSYIPSNYK